MRFPTFLKSLLLGVPVGVTLLDCVGYVARVEGVSMQPALNPDATVTDYVFLSRWAVRNMDVQRGDIISLISPKDPTQKIIKRVVALQGDVISTLGYKLPYVTVPEGHCWVEGDHTGNSLDSNTFGPVSLGLTLTEKPYTLRYAPKDVKEQESKVISTNRKDAKAIAVAKLQAGEVIAIPTDTVYGLTCSANNPEAIHRLYNIKGRHQLKPVAICVASIEDVRQWGETDHLNDELLGELFPGAVTLVVRRSSKLNNPALNPGVANIGIRITENKFIQHVCEAFQQPIALTSANKSSSKSTLNVEEFKELWGELGAVFDGGQLGLSEEQRAASTVIDLSEPERYKIIRWGVSVEKIIETVERHNFREAL
uniref:Mitochondrial inner membrane protease subunit 2 n=1 Tax=Anopheles coluzzii TaxID=1518534 RepID=A0A8W7P480_ANOCL